MFNNCIGRNCCDGFVGFKFVGGIILDRNYGVCNGNEYWYMYLIRLFWFFKIRFIFFLFLKNNFIC